MFEAKTYGISTGDRIHQMNQQRAMQDKLLKGGATTVPQFQQTGIPAGPTNANTHITGMAKSQLTANAQSQYNNCVGQPKGTCGGSRRRRRRSRKYKVKH